MCWKGVLNNVTNLMLLTKCVAGAFSGIVLLLNVPPRPSLLPLLLLRAKLWGGKPGRNYGHGQWLLILDSHIISYVGYYSNTWAWSVSHLDPHISYHILRRRLISLD